MKAEEKVKHVYPDAWFRIAGPRDSMIRAGELILAETLSRDRRERWQYAWEKIKTQQPPTGANEEGNHVE